MALRTTVPIQTVRHEHDTHSPLAATITRATSQQTYYTIRFLADRCRVQDAYRAYAYFRWVDDWLDQPGGAQADKITFAQRQMALIDACSRGTPPANLSDEEQLVADLITRNEDVDSRLTSYIHHMMAVMTFDAHRRGQRISYRELADYSHSLSVAVTDALHYFIGHDDPLPPAEIRYQAVTAAHVTHMLRDTCEDVANGYFNIPCEFLERHRIDPKDVDSDAYRLWVQNRVAFARSLFDAGRCYLSQVRCRRCQMAGYSYMARFESVLDSIERDDYRLRPAYPPQSRLSTILRLSKSILSQVL